MVCLPPIPPWRNRYGLARIGGAQSIEETLLKIPTCTGVGDEILVLGNVGLNTKDTTKLADGREQPVGIVLSDVLVEYDSDGVDAVGHPCSVAHHDAERYGLTEIGGGK